MKKKPEMTPCMLFKAEESVGYLLARSRAKLAKSLDIDLSQHDITHAQGSIVLMLASGKYTTATDLARELYIDSASMTRMVDRLEKRGLLERVPSIEDRRVTYLKLTVDGYALAARLPPVYVGVLERNFAGFQEAELKTLKTLLRKYLDSEVS